MPFDEKPHLFTILNDPCTDKLCLIVMISTIYANKKHDAACILDAGDHPFIGHPSYLVYRLADTIRAHQISDLIGRKYYVAKEDFEPAVFKRITDGLFASDNTKGRILKYADEVGV